MSNTAATISTAAGDLLPGDIVFGHDGTDLTVDTVFNDEGFGTWVYWTTGERDSYPVGYRVHRIEA